MSGFHYTMSKSGVTEILKSDAVKAELELLAEEKTDEANRMLHSHNANAGDHEYMHHGKNLRHTAIESVHTTGTTTESDQKNHHTLNAINH